jgi:hypothetical protein
MRPLAIDPKITEEFLMTQEGVVDASVWLDDGHFRAHATVHEGGASEQQLLRACVTVIGQRFTPEAIEILRPQG